MSSEQAPGRPYHHLADGTFRNPPGSPQRMATTGDFLSFLFRRIAAGANPPVPPPGHVLPEAEALAGWHALNGRDGLTWLGHAAFLIRIGGKTVLTDPYLTRRAGPDIFGADRFAGPGIRVENLPPIDVLVISHNHYDHLDARAVEALAGKERVTVVAPLKLGDYFRSRGYANVVDLDWYVSHRIGALEVQALPAIHFSRRGPFDRNATLWASYRLASPELNLYFSGDTAYGPVFPEIGRRTGPYDAALVAIGAYLPRSIMKASHVNPEEAVQLARDIGARRIVGMHWGTVVLTDEPAFEPPGRTRAAAAAAGYAPDDLWIMAIGETRPLRPWPSN